VQPAESVEDQISELLDDRDFQYIDAQLRRFNLFEAIGAVRVELRHSNFLAFLLSPGRSHGLGADILARFLRAAISQLPAEKRPIGVLRIVVGDLDTAFVERERDNIDILIEIKALRLVVVIENKVGADVSEGQLGRYKAIILNRYKGWHHLFLLLTPEGERPGDPLDDDSDYVAISYYDLATLLKKYVEEKRNLLSDEMVLILDNYIETLRRYIVEDSELKETARQLYVRHKEAFDFIFSSRPAPDDLLQALRSKLEASTDFVLDRPGSLLIRFAASNWINKPLLNSCPEDRWTRSRRNLLFELRAYRTDRVSLSLILGPSEDEFRQHVYFHAGRQPAVFIGMTKPMGLRTSTIYIRDLLSARAAPNMDESEKQAVLIAGWDEFVERDLPLLKSEIEKIVESYQPQRYDNRRVVEP
jgi:hypothetical protein